MIMLFRLLAIILCLFLMFPLMLSIAIRIKTEVLSLSKRQCRRSEFRKMLNLAKKSGKVMTSRSMFFATMPANGQRPHQQRRFTPWIKLSEFNDPVVLNNPYLKFGVTYNGQDYEANGQGSIQEPALTEKIRLEVNTQLKLVMARRIREMSNSMPDFACMLNS